MFGSIFNASDVINYSTVNINYIQPYMHLSTTSYMYIFRAWCVGYKLSPINIQADAGAKITATSLGFLERGCKCKLILGGSFHVFFHALFQMMHTIVRFRTTSFTPKKVWYSYCINLSNVSQADFFLPCLHRILEEKIRQIPKFTLCGPRWLVINRISPT